MSDEIIDIPSVIDQAKARKIERWPVRANYASRAGAECLRQMVYERVAWKEKILHDVGLQYIFDEGNRTERAILEDFSEAGIALLEGQRRYEDPWGLEISGKIDGKIIIMLEGKRLRVPIEFKSINPYGFQTIVPNSVESVANHKSPYVRGYLAQLLLYMAMEEPEPAEYGVLLFKNKSTGRYKQIVVRMDLDKVEELKKRFALVNEHVRRWKDCAEEDARDATLPERVKDRTICKSCAFRHICVPDQDFNAVTDIRTDRFLESLLERAIATTPAAREHDELDEEIKTLIKGWADANMKADKETLFVISGRFEVTVKRHGKNWRVDYARMGDGQEVET